MMTSEAVLVIDMVNDFVTGAIGCARAERIISPLQTLLGGARAAEVPVIYVSDAHLPSDFEIDLWGEHAMKGTEGASIIPALAPAPDDLVLEKRTYSAFYDTGLDQLLRSLDVHTLYLTGLHTNMCCRHTAADAYVRGYGLVAVTDGCEAFTEAEHEDGLDYLERVYGAGRESVEEALAHWAAPVR
jgi:nicotinamidase-related amidase